MKRLTLMSFLLCILLISLTFLFFNLSDVTAGSGHEKTLHTTAKEEVPFDRPVEEIEKYLAPMNEFKLFKDKELEVSSCTECHDEEWETNSEKRALDEPHDKYPGKFVNHDSENRWCLDCHSAKKRDKLRLINGKLIDFKEYYKVCAQCHRKVYRQWKMGVHGKRTGYWNGVKEYQHCTQCHDPHNPPFKPLKPMPAPRKPLDIRVKLKK